MLVTDFFVIIAESGVDLANSVWSKYTADSNNQDTVIKFPSLAYLLPELLQMRVSQCPHIKIEFKIPVEQLKSTSRLNPR